MVKRPLILLVLLCLSSRAWAEPNYPKLAQAIYIAEGGSHTLHPYGIMAHYRHTSPKQACLNTLHHQWHKWAVLSPTERSRCPEGFLRYLQRSYAPLNASNDHLNLNINWYFNVCHYYQR